MIGGFFFGLVELFVALVGSLEPRVQRVPRRRRKSPQEALRIAARRLNLAHARGRIWGQLDEFVSASLEGGSAAPSCRIVAKLRPSLELGLDLVPRQIEAPRLHGAAVDLDPPLADHFRAFAREPQIACRLLRGPTLRTLLDIPEDRAPRVNDDRVELLLDPGTYSSRSIVEAVRAVASLAHNIGIDRASLPRSDHDERMQAAWASEALSRGGRFDPLENVLRFELASGHVRAQIVLYRASSQTPQKWRTTVEFAFTRSLESRPLRVPEDALPEQARLALRELEALVDALEIDESRLVAYVVEPVASLDGLRALLDVLARAGDALDAALGRRRGPYR